MSSSNPDVTCIFFKQTRLIQIEIIFTATQKKVENLFQTQSIKDEKNKTLLFY